MIFDDTHPWTTTTWNDRYDYLAPDGSEIRLLAEVSGGGLSHCILPAGLTSHAVYHRTVDEVWFFVSGSGEVWRKEATHEQMVPVNVGTSINIVHGTHFQFRNTGTAPLCLLIMTIPRWPGRPEAVPVPGYWPPTEGP